MIKNKFQVGDEVLVRHPRHGLFDEPIVREIRGKKTCLINGRRYLFYWFPGTIGWVEENKVKPF